MAGQGPRLKWSRDGRRAMELPTRSPFLSQQLVSLLAPSAWIRGPGWTDWPVGEDHSQKTLLISHRLPRPHSHTLSLFLSSLCTDFSSKLCRGRAEDSENMSSWAPFQTHISTIRRKRGTYSYNIMRWRYPPSYEDITPQNSASLQTHSAFYNNQCTYSLFYILIICHSNHFLSLPFRKMLINEGIKRQKHPVGKVNVEL